MGQRFQCSIPKSLRILESGYEWRCCWGEGCDRLNVAVLEHSYRPLMKGKQCVYTETAF